MKNSMSTSSLKNSFKEQQIISNDERFIHIIEKTSHSVSKIMNWILFALLFITGAIIKEYVSFFIITTLIIIKLIITSFYSYYYNHIL